MKETLLLPVYYEKSLFSFHIRKPYLQDTFSLQSWYFKEMVFQILMRSCGGISDFNFKAY